MTGKFTRANHDPFDERKHADRLRRPIAAPVLPANVTVLPRPVTDLDAYRTARQQRGVRGPMDGAA